MHMRLGNAHSGGTSIFDQGDETLDREDANRQIPAVLPIMSSQLLELQIGLHSVWQSHA